MFKDDEYNWEGDHCLLPNGFGAIPDAFARLPEMENVIEFEAMVTRIEYEPSEANSDIEIKDSDEFGTRKQTAPAPTSDSVRVHYERNGTFSVKKIKRIYAEFRTGESSFIDADAVVVSIPLGPLKAGRIEFFPKLPSWKLGALDRLGFGNLNKVVLEFPHVFWDETQDIFGRVVPADEDDTSLPVSTDAGGKSFVSNQFHWF